MNERMNRTVTLPRRPLGRTGLEVSILGFGCMRLPVERPSGLATDPFDPAKRVDAAAATALIREAHARGVNYFDTAWPYHGGQSEVVLGAAVSPFRDEVLLATKSPVWMVQAHGDFDRLLDEQLRRLDTDRVDVYLLHALNRTVWPHLKETGFASFLDRVRRDGRARHVGFSFHDDLETFRDILGSYDWEVCQIQYNFFDVDFQAGLAGLRLAAERGGGIVVMEPLRGGRLVDPLPAEVRALWEEAPRRRTPAAWALQWVWDHPQVATALSGMGAAAELAENLAAAAAAGPLTETERSLVARVREAYRRLLRVPCTGCAYCLPCPNGVNIPTNFALYNDACMFKDPEIAVLSYRHFLPPPARASACLACGECEPKCPQGIAVAHRLAEVHARLGAPGPETVDAP